MFNDNFKMKIFIHNSPLNSRHSPLPSKLLEIYHYSFGIDHSEVIVPLCLYSFLCLVPCALYLVPCTFSIIFVYH